MFRYWFASLLGFSSFFLLYSPSNSDAALRKEAIERAARSAAKTDAPVVVDVTKLSEKKVQTKRLRPSSASKQGLQGKQKKQLPKRRRFVQRTTTADGRNVVAVNLGDKVRLPKDPSVTLVKLDNVPLKRKARGSAGGSDAAADEVIPLIYIADADAPILPQLGIDDRIAAELVPFETRQRLLGDAAAVEDTIPAHLPGHEPVFSDTPPAYPVRPEPRNHELLQRKIEEQRAMKLSKVEAAIGEGDAEFARRLAAEEAGEAALDDTASAAASAEGFDGATGTVIEELDDDAALAQKLADEERSEMLAAEMAIQEKRQAAENKLDGILHNMMLDPHTKHQRVKRIIYQTDEILDHERYSLEEGVTEAFMRGKSREAAELATTLRESGADKVQIETQEQLARAWAPTPTKMANLWKAHEERVDQTVEQLIESYESVIVPQYLRDRRAISIEEFQRQRAAKEAQKTLEQDLEREAAKQRQAALAAEEAELKARLQQVREARRADETIEEGVREAVRAGIPETNVRAHARKAQAIERNLPSMEGYAPYMAAYGRGNPSAAPAAEISSSIGGPPSAVAHLDSHHRGAYGGTYEEAYIPGGDGGFDHSAGGGGYDSAMVRGGEGGEAELTTTTASHYSSYGAGLPPPHPSLARQDSGRAAEAFVESNWEQIQGLVEANVPLGEFVPDLVAPSGLDPQVVHLMIESKLSAKGIMLSQ